MERPPLLSPVVPRLPGAAPTEPPPLRAADFTPRPPPIECDPLPATVAQRLASGEGMMVALEGFQKHSQLAWCQAQAAQRQARRRQQQQQQRQEDAVEGASPRQQQGERPARAFRPAAAPAAESDSEGAVTSDPVLRPSSRASAALQARKQQQQPAPEQLAEHGAFASLLAAPPPPAGGPAAAARPAPRRQQRQPQQRRQPAGNLQQATEQERLRPEQQHAAAQEEESEDELGAQLEAELQDADMADAAGGGGDDAPPPPPADNGGAAAAAAAAATAAAAAAAAGRTAAAAAGGGPQMAGRVASEAEDEEEAHAARQQTAQEQAVAAALQKLGEAGWEEFSRSLQQRAEAVGGGGGRGRGRKGGGRGRGGRGGGAAGEAAAVQLASVLNKTSCFYHPEFAAAYHAAKEELNRLGVKRQRHEERQEYSKLVQRTSSLAPQEHAWFLAHQGQHLVGSDVQRMAVLQGRVTEEQAAYSAEVEARACGGTQAQRYQKVTPRQDAQLDDDAAARRRRVAATLPRWYHLREVLPLPTAVPLAPLGAPPPPPEALLRHLGQLHREGRPPAFEPPPAGSSIKGELRYLPCSLPAGSASAAAPAGVYRKAEVPPLADDPLLPQLAQRAWQLEGLAPQQEAAGDAVGASGPLFCMAASAFTTLVSTPMLNRGPGWEIPVTVQQLPAGGGPAAGGAAAGQAGSGGGSGGGGTLVCVEKPLQQRTLTMRAKQQRLQKYAVMSMAVRTSDQQEQQPQQEQQQQQQGGATPARRSTRRSTRKAAASPPPDAAPAPAPAPPQAPALPPREAAYDCWQLGTCRLLLRSHGRLLLQPPAELAGGAAGGDSEQQQQQARPAVLALKTEYLPDPDQEEFILDETFRWWLQLLIRPGVEAVLAARAHVWHSKLLGTEALTAADLELLSLADDERERARGPAGSAAAAARMQLVAGAGLALLGQLLPLLGRMPPGRYLLAHSPGEDTCCLFKALSPEAAEAVEEKPPPLPCSATVAQPGSIYDLHAAHERSGATSAVTTYIPPRWRPFRPDMPQIKYTFPLSLKVSRQERLFKKRQRKQQPTAWNVLGRGGDFDQVGHVAQVSRADYMANLVEGLD